MMNMMMNKASVLKANMMRTVEGKVRHLCSWGKRKGEQATDHVVKLVDIVKQRMQMFQAEARGDAMMWVVGIFFGLLLMIAVYVLFKAQIDTFVVDKIFGKMNIM